MIELKKEAYSPIVTAKEMGENRPALIFYWPLRGPPQVPCFVQMAYVKEAVVGAGMAIGGMEQPQFYHNMGILYHRILKKC